MNIRNDLQPIQPLMGDAQVSVATKTSGSTAASLVTNSDQAHLSGVASLASHAASLSDVRSEKVASVQAAIVSGNYNVSSTDLAQSLMSHMFGNQE